MALPQSALFELLDAIKAGERLDLVRRGVALEIAGFCSATPLRFSHSRLASAGG
jgi:hypothetical protein